MRFLAFLFVFLSSFVALAKEPIKVAVLDTGLQKPFFGTSQICATGHKDFTGQGLDDVHGHGTNIAGTIINNAGFNNYCLIIIKTYKVGSSKNLQFLRQGLEYALKLNVNVINYSGGGIDPSEKEREIILKLLKKNVIIVVSAGNEHQNLDEKCNYYPACYDERIFVVSNTESYANKGRIVDAYEKRSSIGFGVYMSGTSQSTAIFTGKMLKKFANKNKEK